MVVRRLLLALLCLFSLKTAEAATYYVSPSPAGSDARSCAVSQTIGTPRATIVAGISCLSAGDTLLVRAGTYDELVGSTPSGTDWTNKVRIAAYPGETVWLHPTGNPAAYALYFWHLEKYVEWDGINIDGSAVQFGPVKIEGYDVSIGNPHHIRMQNLEIIADPNSTPGAGHNGILVSAQVSGLQDGHNEFLNLTIHRLRGYGFYISANQNLVDHCTVYDGNGAGIHVSNSYNDGAGNFNIISNNIVHDILGGQPGFNPSVWGIVNGSGAPSNNTYFNNVIYNIGGSTSGDAGIYLLTGDSVNLWNNTVYGGGGFGIRVSQASVTSTTIQNNVVYGSALGNYSNAGTGTTHDHNLEGPDPLFVNSASHNFHILVGSLARNAGTALGSVTVDFDGTARPQEGTYDMGAYEYTSGVIPSTPVSSSADMGWFWRVHHF